MENIDGLGNIPSQLLLKDITHTPLPTCCDCAKDMRRGSESTSCSCSTYRVGDTPKEIRSIVKIGIALTVNLLLGRTDCAIGTAASSTGTSDN